MKRLPGLSAALAAALLLSGCGLLGSRGPQIPPEQDTPAHRACREEARRSPEARALDRQSNPFDTVNRQRIAEERAAVERSAYRDCLRRAGLAAPGGVEVIRRR